METAKELEMDHIINCFEHLYITITPTDEGAERLREEQCAAVSLPDLACYGYLDDNIKEFGDKRIIMIDDARDPIILDAAEVLKRIATSVTLVKLPGQEDGDILAWLNKPGNSYDAFFRICEAAVALSPPLVAAAKSTPRNEAARATEGFPWNEVTPAADRSSTEKNDIRVICDLREESTDRWFRLIAFADRDGNPQEVIIPMYWFSGGGAKVIEKLLENGYKVPMGKQDREHLLYTLYSSTPDGPTRRLVTKIGWHGSSFVLPSQIIGPDKNRLGFNGPRACAVDQEGTLDEWREKIGKYCIGNSRLALGVSLAFAGPLLQILGLENGGVHFVGKNGKGKSTILLAATSVISGKWYCSSWRATVNGLERLGAEHNNLTLILDELGQQDPKEVGEAVYQLGNGALKVRWNGNSSKPLPHFSLAFISSGEISLEEHIHTAGKKVMGGQKDRLVDIPAEPEGGFGVYENLHEFPSGEALSDHLRLQTAKSYGTPLIAYLERLTQNMEESKAFVAEKMDEFQQHYVPEGDKARIARVARRFAVIAAAGELATRHGITGWPNGEAMRSVGVCFQAWFSTTAQSSHCRHKLLAFLEAHGNRFCPAGDNSEDVDNCAGFRRPIKDGGAEYFIHPAVFKNEIFAGFISRRVCAELAQQGLLIRDNDSHNTRVWSPPGSGKASRWFHVVMGESGKL